MRSMLASLALLVLSAPCFAAAPLPSADANMTEAYRLIRAESVRHGRPVDVNVRLSSSAAIGGDLTVTGPSRFAGSVALVGGITGPGLWLQQTSTFTTAYYPNVHPVTPRDDSIPQASEMALLLTSTITPRAATSILQIEAVVNAIEDSNISNDATIAVFVDATADALCAMNQLSGVGHTQALVLRCHVPAANTSSRVYSLRWGADTQNAIGINGIGAGRIFGGTAHSGMTITEVGQ